MPKWTPDAASPALWIDASDASRRIVANGLVAEIKCRAHNYVLSQTSTSLQPAIVQAGLSGKDTISWAAGPKLLLMQEMVPIMRATSAAAHVMLIKLAPNGTTQTVVSVDRMWHQYSNSSVSAGWRLKNFNVSGGSSVLFDDGTAVQQGWAVLVAARDYVNGFRRMRRNGVELSAGSAGVSAPTDDSNIRGIVLGGNPNAHGSTSTAYMTFRGEFAESFLIHDVSLATLQRAEAYLHHSWGIADLLPDTHPYRYEWPTAPGLEGNATVSGGGAVDHVAVFSWPDGARVRVVTPDPSGDWGCALPAGQYGVTYLAAGCRPVTHGPYTVDPE